VLKLTHIQPALIPPRVETTRVRWNASSRAAECEVVLQSLGDAQSVEIGAEFRDITGLDVNERTDNWKSAALRSRSSAGPETISLPTLQSGHNYEFRAMVKHPLLTVYGKELRLKVP
jgi:alpha-L-fucosidase